MDREKIICEICKENNKKEKNNNAYYRCNTCNINICSLCQSKHKKKHKIINYDVKDYICNIHNENYVSYCEDCKINICALCVEHKEHKIMSFANIIPEEVLINKKSQLYEYLCKINIEANTIINILKDVIDKIFLYYKINEDIIKDYNKKYRNYEMINILNK